MLIRLSILAVCAAFVAPAFAAPTQPNIVLFLVDDMGWQDTSVAFWTERTAFNDRYRTPNMQKLADTGMKFTQAYACSVCSPTRVSVMTGLNAARHRVTNWTLYKDKAQGGNHPRLKAPTDWNVNGITQQPGDPRALYVKTLPQHLKDAGYRTIFAGKAHFGAVDTPGENPVNVGFDVNIAGHAAGGPGSFLGTQNFSAAFRNGSRVWDVPGLEKYHGKDIFLTEALTIEANKAVDASVAARKPFFLYMSHYAVHVPFAPDKRFYQKYRDAGLDHTEAMYAAMIEGMDKSLGDILANIDRHGLTDDTIVIFMSDNGGLSAHGRGGPKHSHNKPLSSGKGSAHEGGVREPMIVRWPGVTETGSKCNTPLIIEDFLPSILELAGITAPPHISKADTTTTANAPSVANAHIDGVSFVPMLRGKRVDNSARPFVWHYPHRWGPSGPGIGSTSTLRLGDHKLVYYHDPGRKVRYELFNIAADIGESKNLADANPELRQQLAVRLAHELQTMHAQMPTIKATSQPVAWPGE